jgi:hypothetical protein
MRRLAMFVAAIVATVALQTTLSPAATASAARGIESISTVTGAVATGGSADAAAGWVHWDNYYSHDYCEFIGAMGKLSGGWQTYYCDYEEGSEKPWALHVYL